MNICPPVFSLFCDQGRDFQKLFGTLDDSAQCILAKMPKSFIFGMLKRKEEISAGKNLNFRLGSNKKERRRIRIYCTPACWKYAEEWLSAKKMRKNVINENEKLIDTNWEILICSQTRFSFKKAILLFFLYRDFFQRIFLVASRSFKKFFI